MLMPGSGSVEAPAPPPDYDIEVIIEEDYINRSMSDNLSGSPSPVPVLGAHLDVRPGGQADFIAQVELGPFQPVIHGTVALRATPNGQLEVEIVDVRLGYLPVTMFIPSGPIDQMNADINKMMLERAGGMQARVVGVGGDETTLRFYLAADL